MTEKMAETKPALKEKKQGRTQNKVIKKSFKKQ